MVLRRRAGWEVLMVLRPVRGAFGGAWVFPGGAVDDVDHDAGLFGFDDPWRAAAARETAEEVNVFLTDPPLSTDQRSSDVIEFVRRAGARFDPERLRYVSTLVTPEGVPRRFDTRFFVAEVEADTVAVLCDEELVDMRWIEPGEALERHDSGEFPMILPTILHLRLIRDADDPTTVTVPEPFRVSLVDGVPTVVAPEGDR
jgi:8-oxo-dGTP pyrophosphatase MutT (NUDIX family)